MTRGNGRQSGAQRGQLPLVIIVLMITHGLGGSGVVVGVKRARGDEKAAEGGHRPFRVAVRCSFFDRRRSA